MALTTYNDLKNAVANWLHRSDLTSYLDDFITLGEDRIYRKLRHKDMEQALAITTAAATVPSDYVQLRHAYVDTSPVRVLDVVSPHIIYRKFPQRDATDIPRLIAREGGSFIFGPAADGTYDVNGIYYKRLDALATTVNTIYTTHPGLWLFASLCETAPFLKNDERLGLWEQRFQTILEEVNKEEEDYTRSGSLVMQWS